MPRFPLASSPSGEFGVDHQNNGRVNAIYCTDPRGTFARVILADGTVFEGSLTSGQTLAIPGGRVTVVNDPTNGRQLSPVAAIHLFWGA